MVRLWKSVLKITLAQKRETQNVVYSQPTAAARRPRAGGRARGVDGIDVGAGFDQGGRDALDSVADGDVEQRGGVVSHIGTRPITQIQLPNAAVVTQVAQSPEGE